MIVTLLKSLSSSKLVATGSANMTTLTTLTTPATGNLAESPTPNSQDPRTTRLLTAPALPLLLKLASPNALAFLIQACVSMTEVWFVGQLGTASLAAIALMFPLLMLMQMLANGSLGGAVTGVIARTLGGGHTEQAEALIWHALVLAVSAGVAFLLIALLLLEPALAAITSDEQVIAEARRYGFILFAGSPLLWAMALLSSVYRGMGNMQFPALVMVANAIIQVPLSGALILGWFGLPGLGIAGAALSLLTVSALSCGVLLWGLRRPDSRLRLRTDRARFRSSAFYAILKVGAPSALSPLLTVATIGGINVLIGELGVAALAGYGIGSRIEFLLIPLVFGLGVAMNTLVGVNLGAGQLQRAVNIGWIGGVCASVLTGVIGLLASVAPDLWVSLFTDDPDALASARSYLRIVGPFFAFQGLGLSLFFASQGAGTVTWPVIATFLRLAVALGGGAVALHTFAAGLDGIYLAAGVGMLVYGVITAAALKLGVWEKVSHSGS